MGGASRCLGGDWALSSDVGDAWARFDRERLSRWIAFVGATGMVAIGLTRFLRDGSFWLDEAYIAANLLQQDLPELFGPYFTGHSFPRLYLVTIALLERAFGYETGVLRALPFLAFVGAILAWTRLMYVRFREAPEKLLLVIVIALLPATLFAYGAMLKQYSLDVLVALIPFLLSDDYFEERLREGKRTRSLIALPLLCLVSFTFVIPLLARVLGWYCSGLAHGRRTIDVATLAWFGTVLALALTALWGIDLRHTAAHDGLFDFWRKCIPAADWSKTPALLLGFVPGWYEVTPFGARTPLPMPLVFILSGAFVLGVGEAARRAVSARAVDSPGLARWGSRSLGCVICLGGLFAASVVVDYPLCPGRLTLFSLFAVQILTLEGFQALGSWGPKPPARRRAAIAATLAFTALCLPATYVSVRYMIVRDVPENVRPLIPMIEQEPDLPVVVASCSTYQVSTLPEWLDEEKVEYYDQRVTEGKTGYPEGEFWFLSAGTGFYCPWFISSLEFFADEMVRHSKLVHTAGLYRVKLSNIPPRPNRKPERPSP